VNRTLAELLLSRERELRDLCGGISWRITGIASRRLGWIANPEGLDVALLCGDRTLARESFPGATAYTDVRQWLRAAKADVLFEATSLNARTGEPAIDHLRAALEMGAHAITANKGPIVHAYEELSDLSSAKGKRFLFESTVMDGVPIFSLFRDTLPTVRLQGFRGILNSTTNVILTGMEQGASFEQSLKKAQEVGVAEADASDDIDGWDAAVKVAALVRVLMGVKLCLDDISREGIRNLSGERVRSARAEGRPFKLVCQAVREGSNIVASIRPEQVPLSDPMAMVEGTSSVICFQTDIFPELTIVETDPGLEATAYGLVADFVRAVKGAS
jgi:homoserine dehydrogenase